MEAQLAGVLRTGDTWTAEVRLACPKERSLAGRVVGNLAPRSSTGAGGHRAVAVEQEDQEARGGQSVRMFRWRYERVGSQPQRLVFDLYSRGGKQRDFPFVVRDLPLLGSGEPDPPRHSPMKRAGDRPLGSLWRAGSDGDPHRRSLAADAGGLDGLGVGSTWRRMSRAARSWKGLPRVATAC